MSARSARPPVCNMCWFSGQSDEEVHTCLGGDCSCAGAHRDPLTEFIRARYVEHTRVVEQACEVALQGGVCGVRVFWDAMGTTATVDPSVPYGHIYEHTIGTQPRSVFP